MEENREEILEQNRQRRIATLKASNEMLEQAKATALQHTTDPVRRAMLEEQFNTAVNENKTYAKNHLNSTEDEMNNASYRQVDEKYVKEYEEMLKKRGITAENLENKEGGNVIYNNKSEDNDKAIRRQRRTKKKENEDIVRIKDEEELMKSTMVKSEKDIEQHRLKNKEYENGLHKEKQNPFNKVNEKIKDAVSSKKVQTDQETPEYIKVDNTINKTMSKPKKQNTQSKPKKDNNVVQYDFDFNEIPQWVQYDVLPLPSNGMCYPINSPLRCGRIPVAYLTAADENIIASPNVYRDGKLLDIIVDRKILDKRIDVKDLVEGDRDAIVLWLRATAYGNILPISATNPSTRKQYSVEISLDQFKYNQFNLEGDEDGLFTYTTKNNDEIKFKFFTKYDNDVLKKNISSQIMDVNKIEILKNMVSVSNLLSQMEFTDEEIDMLTEDIDEIRSIIGDDIEEGNEEVILNTVTEQMVMHTVSINGNDDREYIKNYVENMRAGDAFDYRNYFITNKPGVDLNFEVKIPESDGGGSFNTFLTINDSILIQF